MNLCTARPRGTRILVPEQNRAAQIFLDPIQKRALSWSVQLEAVYLEALLYIEK